MRGGALTQQVSLGGYINASSYCIGMVTELDAISKQGASFCLCRESTALSGLREVRPTSSGTDARCPEAQLSRATRFVFILPFAPSSTTVYNVESRLCYDSIIQEKLTGGLVSGIHVMLPIRFRLLCHISFACVFILACVGILYTTLQAR